MSEEREEERRVALITLCATIIHVSGISEEQAVWDARGIYEMVIAEESKGWVISDKPPQR